MTDRRMKIKRAVRLAAVQEHRDSDDGDVGKRQSDDNIAPPGQVEYAGKKHPVPLNVQPLPNSFRFPAQYPSKLPEQTSINQKSREGKAECCEKEKQLAEKNELFPCFHFLEFLFPTCWLTHDVFSDW
jgi:hypothetical protein